jgi:hypothetical protein
MLDLALNKDFSVFLDDSGDLASVDGREQFEQSVVVLMTELLRTSLIGEFERDTIRQKLKLEAARVARRHEKISEISSIEIAPDPDNPHKYNVSINYRSEGTFQGTIGE